jgi:hypothetical protein
LKAPESGPGSKSGNKDQVMLGLPKRLSPPC